jgi:hypothetical protein
VVAVAVGQDDVVDVGETQPRLGGQLRRHRGNCRKRPQSIKDVFSPLEAPPMTRAAGGYSFIGKEKYIFAVIHPLGKISWRTSVCIS